MQIFWKLQVPGRAQGAKEVPESGKGQQPWVLWDSQKENPAAITDKLCITIRNFWNLGGDIGETPGLELQIIPCLQEEPAQALLPP